MSSRRRSWVALALTAALTLAACGGSAKKNEATSSTTQAPSARTASFRGVTADTIKLGVILVDFDAIKQFVDFNRGDQQKTMQIFVDDVNAHGGILGRKIEPVYRSYSPIGNAKALEACTAFTEDDKVFAVIGGLIDFSGDAQLCLSRDHQTIHIGHELRQPWIDEAPPATLLTPDITAERRVNVLVNLLKRENTLKGKKVAVLGDQDTKQAIDGVIKPGLDSLKQAQGSTAILNIAGPDDTTAALTQLESFIEKWKSEKVDAVFLSGQRVEAKVYVDKIKASMPDVQLLADQPSGVIAAAQDAVSAGQKPNPYEGILSTDNQSESERWKNKPPKLQQCVDVYEKATGQKIVGPDDLKPGPDGKRVEIYVSVTDLCGVLQMFQTIAEKAGPNLTNDSWRKAVDGFGHIDIATTTIASLGKGKYDAADGFELIHFDSTIGTKGDWKALTDVIDASKG